MTDWHENRHYLTRFGICDYCGEGNLVKLAFDQHRWLCLNPSPCFSKGNRRMLIAHGYLQADEVNDISDLIGVLADLYN